MTSDDEDDSVLRALAAAPALAPPSRMVTAMVIRLGDAAPVADQIDSIRRLVAALGAEVVVRADGTLSVLWSEPARAASVALELRDALPETRIALATARVTGAAATAAGVAIDAARALLDGAGARIAVDGPTALAIEKGFQLELDDDGSRIVLVEPRASGTPPHLGKVLGNYRILRLLGTGGMGVVYVAEHVTLGRKAVIKFTQDKLAHDAESEARFFTEARTAASIRHPGIVDVFDFGKDEHGRPYIVMELLEGESLRTRLRREHPLPIDLALALAAQIASAVAAAHAAGVIHRDLKPDNLFLVADPEAAHKLRVKVLDFGLAKVTSGGEPGVTLSGHVVGTPLYMSPEQCRSKAAIDHRTDIYSLGCILFEMVCGRLPFLDKTVGDLIIAHTSLPPPAPSSVRPEVTPPLDRAILRALAKEPDERFASMEEVASVISELVRAPAPALAVATPVARPVRPSAPPPNVEEPARAEATPTTGPAPVPRRPTRWIVLGGGVVLLAAAAAIVVGLSRRATTTRAAPSGHRTIAVVDLANTSRRAESGWLSTALAEVMATDLRGGGELQVAPGDDVARMKAELGVGEGAEWTRERLEKVRSYLGADYLVTGSYLALGSASGGQVRVDVQLYDTQTGAELTHASATGMESNLIELGSRVAGSVRQELGVEAPVAVTAPAVLPANAAAARDYSEGLAKLRRFDLIEARALFEKAAGEDANDPLVHAALATVWHGLGYETKAGTEAKLAFDLSTMLPRENQLAIEALYRETTGQWDQAIKAYQTLTEFFPTRLDYGLALAAAQTRAGDVKSAYATLGALRKLPPPVGSDPRIELAEADAAEQADDIERERAHSERAALLARKRGARMLLANALLREGWAVWTLGRDAEARPLYDEAKQLFGELGDRSGLARTLNNIALAYHRAHQDDDATRTFADVLRVSEEIGDTQTQAWALQNWGYVLADAGDLAKALELDRKKIALGVERGDTASSQAAAHANVAEILRWRGDLDGASTECAAAEDLLRGVDARRFAAFAAYQCGEALHARNDLDGARKRLDQALGWASDVMTPAETAEIRIAKARLELDAGRPGEAEPLARAALADLRAAKESSQQVCASAVLAATLLAAGGTKAAADEIAALSSLPAQGVSFACRLEADLVAAQVAVAGDPAQRASALASLEAARQRAASATFVQFENQLRLAIGVLDEARGQERLRALADDAGKLGFKLVALRARDAAAHHRGAGTLAPVIP